MKPHEFWSRHHNLLTLARGIVLAFDELEEMSGGPTPSDAERITYLEDELDHLLDELVLAAAAVGREN